MTQEWPAKRSILYCHLRFDGGLLPGASSSREDPYIKVALRWRFDISVVCVCLAASFLNEQL